MCDSLRAGQGVDPVIGFWRLNVEKSRSTGRIPWSETRRYQCDSAGIRLTETRVSADGHTSQIQYIVNYDGKEHAVFVANNGEKAPHQTSETMVFTRLDPYTVEGVSRVQGKLAYTFSRTVSADGRTLTIETVSAGMRTPLNISVLVYEKAVARMCTH